MTYQTKYTSSVDNLLGKLKTSPKRGRVVYEEDGSGFYWTKCDLNFQRHRHRLLNAWCSDDYVLSILYQVSDCLGIRVHTTDGRVYTSTLLAWVLHGVKVPPGKDVKEPQTGLHLKWWAESYAEGSNVA